MAMLADLLHVDAAHAWLTLPAAILLGALHGLEPGHSKTMMAAFIIAVRGTVGQAILLGLAATLSHTLVVWAVALGGLWLGSQWSAAAAEPVFQVGSAGLMIGIAAWMIGRVRRERLHPHHHHGEEVRHIATGDGSLALSIFESGAPPRWRIHLDSGHPLAADAVALTTERAGGARQDFAFADRGGWLESVETIPEPHEFAACLQLRQDGHAHRYELAFAEPGHDLLGGAAAEGTHAASHAAAIRQRLGASRATTAQIALFGLSGGLIPCPAAITVLLLCLQLRQLSLGVGLVLCFSVGLAMTLVAAGVLAALSVRHVARRWPGLGALAARAPYVSGALIIGVGLYMGWQGLAAMGAS